MYHWRCRLRFQLASGLRCHFHQAERVRHSLHRRSLEPEVLGHQVVPQQLQDRERVVLHQTSQITLRTGTVVAAVVVVVVAAVADCQYFQLPDLPLAKHPGSKTLGKGA